MILLLVLTISKGRNAGLFTTWKVKNIRCADSLILAHHVTSSSHIAYLVVLVAFRNRSRFGLERFSIECRK